MKSKVKWIQKSPSRWVLSGQDKLSGTIEIEERGGYKVTITVKDRFYNMLLMNRKEFFESKEEAVRFIEAFRSQEFSI